jgi:hypothetical protein
MSEEYNWPMRQDKLEEELGTDRIRQTMNNLIKSKVLVEGEDKDFYIDHSEPRPGSPRSWTFFSKEGAMKIASHLRNPKAKHFLKIIKPEGIFFTPKETHFCGIIKNAIKGFTSCEEQYIVKNGYRIDQERKRIDLYLKEFKLAIECDEKHHRYNIEDDELRQKYLERKFGIEFIRFCPDDPDFNIGEVINRIFHKIVEKKYLLR